MCRIQATPSNDKSDVSAQPDSELHVRNKRAYVRPNATSTILSRSAVGSMLASWIRMRYLRREKLYSIIWAVPENGAQTITPLGFLGDP